jgi:hypothetical protein
MIKLVGVEIIERGGGEYKKLNELGMRLTLQISLK